MDNIGQVFGVTALDTQTATQSAAFQIQGLFDVSL